MQTDPDSGLSGPSADFPNAGFRCFSDKMFFVCCWGYVLEPERDSKGPVGISHCIHNNQQNRAEKKKAIQ